MQLFAGEPHQVVKSLYPNTLTHILLVETFFSSELLISLLLPPPFLLPFLPLHPILPPILFPITSPYPSLLPPPPLS
jgi:hypothetical protein